MRSRFIGLILMLTMAGGLARAQAPVSPGAYYPPGRYLPVAAWTPPPGQYSGRPRVVGWPPDPRALADKLGVRPQPPIRPQVAPEPPLARQTSRSLHGTEESGAQAPPLPEAAAPAGATPSHAGQEPAVPPVPPPSPPGSSCTMGCCPGGCLPDPAVCSSGVCGASAGDPWGCCPADVVVCGEPAPVCEMHRPDHHPHGYWFYGSLEYLHWWLRDQNGPPLVSTGPLVGPGNQFLQNTLGNTDNNQLDGLRGTFGFWLDAWHVWALEATVLYMVPDRTSTTFRNGDVVRPFFNALTRQEDAVVIAQPGVLTGFVRIEQRHQLWATEINVRHSKCVVPGFRFDWLCGARVLNLDESVDIQDNSTDRIGPNAGRVIASSDRFGTRNWVFAAQCGAEAEWQWWRLALDVWGKLGFGVNYEVVNIGGTTVIQQPGGLPQAFPVGLLAQKTNIGRQNNVQAVLLPEVGVNLMFQVTDNIRLYGGYSCLYISNVVRPGDQIDRAVNPSLRAAATNQGPGSGLPRPGSRFVDTEFWAHGVNAGLQIRY